jgi:hypothetical protein
MATLANLDTGEITDKGYVNQRKVLHARSSFVDLFYAEQLHPGVITTQRTQL